MSFGYQKVARHVGRLFELNRDYLAACFEREKKRTIEPIEKTHATKILTEAPCCFVLSTGRCGTGLLTKLLKKNKRILVKHQPAPELVYASSILHSMQKEDIKNIDSFKLAVLAARFELVRDAYYRNRYLVETNNRITFFTPTLSTIFKKSKFIHLVRHPGDFVRSGLRRGYYSPELIDHQRLFPVLGSDAYIKWDQMTRIEKIAWQWNEVQLSANKLKGNINSSRFLTITSEELYTNPTTIETIYNFLEMECPFSPKEITGMLKRPVNKQREGQYPHYNQWKAEDKKQLQRWATCASFYNYTL